MRFLKQAGGRVHLSLPERNLRSDSDVQVRTIAAQTCGFGVRLFGQRPLAALHVRVREIRRPEGGGICQACCFCDVDRSPQVNETFLRVPVDEIRRAQLTQRALVIDARTPGMFVLGDRPALRIDGALHVAQAVVAHASVRQGDRVHQLSVEVLVGDHSLEVLQGIVEPIAEQIRRSKIHKRNGFVIAIAVIQGPRDRLLKNCFGVGPPPLSDQRLTLHRADVEAHVFGGRCVGKL